MTRTQTKLLTPEQVDVLSPLYKDPQTYAVSQALAGRLASFWHTKAIDWSKTAHNNALPAHKATSGVVNRAIRVLWNEYFGDKTLTTVEREYMTQDFIARFLPTQALQRLDVIHPATVMKARPTELYKSPITDVLADFIMNPSIIAERSVSYPIENHDRVIRGEDRRRKNELMIVTDGDADAMRRAEIRIPLGWVSAAATVPNKDDLPPIDEPTVDEFRAELQHVKERAGYYARKYRNRFGLTEKEVRRKIDRMDLGRVAECPICSNAFFKQDLRQEYCNAQGSGKRSTCQKRSRDK